MVGLGKVESNGKTKAGPPAARKDDNKKQRGGNRTGNDNNKGNGRSRFLPFGYAQGAE
jgi:hypothetical protein